MIKKVDILVIGGSAAGLVGAITAKSNHPEKKVMMIRKEEIVMIPCGIPYIFGTLKDSNQNILPDTSLEKLGVELIIDTVVSLEKNKKIVMTENGEEIHFEKLMIATGSIPNIPLWLKGHDLKNVFVIPKNKVYLDEVMKKIEKSKKVIVIGAGFIGVEVSDEIAKLDVDVTLVEIQPHILGQAFDKTVAEIAEGLLTKRGVKVLTGIGVKQLVGDESVKGVVLDNGTEIEADAVILAIGYKANVKLAEDAGIALSSNAFIDVDEYMRTDTKDIYAIGDCASKKDFATGSLCNIMLASTACAEARVAGLNLYSLSTVRSFKGTIGIYSTNIGKTSFGVAGLTERFALAEGFDVCVGEFTGMDRHPGKLNNGQSQTVKLVVSKDSGLVLGGEVIGGDSIGELTNVIGFIIQSGMTITDLLISQIGTQPMLTASPAAYPLIKAAEIVFKKIKG